ncbi:SMP-30/gluconolactonase/LRE family protein [Ideonella azotifigens]|uniref:SMP-30/gluconolactonase/LRE family protein n=1 Tax=Ideonella azotifigens TaxID=513160 RepID=A0ABN1JYK9_9BURK|nr:SMP-30/gluconolactonase/LRE family protein [Ideonella azotifigens]MCD2341503.1 SMP-30/gluconolactonase/LRE family protein [Ideonella azotifigens]
MADHRPELFAEDFIFLEAPHWQDGRLWVSDVFDHSVYALDMQGGRRKVCHVPHRPSGLGFLPDGTPIVVSSKNRKLMRIDGETLVEHADLSNLATGDVNDFVVDRYGRIYVGNFGYDYDAGEPRALTDLHRIERDGTVSVAASGLEFPNGAAIINDGTTLVVAETWAGRLTAFDIDADGHLGHRRVFADLGERHPDGLCGDAEGAIWVGCFNTGEFLRVLEGGVVTDIIAFEGRGVSCTLGGEGGRQLFCTVYRGSIEELVAGRRHGAVFALPVAVPGTDPVRA